jgi:hypothetical protein
MRSTVIWRMRKIPAEVNGRNVYCTTLGRNVYCTTLVKSTINDETTNFFAP